MGRLPLAFRDGAGTSAVGLLVPKALFLWCLSFFCWLKVGCDSYGKVTEGRRQFWYSGKNTDFQDFALRTREE